MQPTNKSGVMGVAFDYLHKSQSKLKAGLRMIALGIGVFGLFNNAWGVCTNVTIIGAEGPQTNSITLCDFSISSSGSVTDPSGDGIVNNGIISALTNSGTIYGGRDGIQNFGTITTLTNSGTISSVDEAIDNFGTITTLTNSGTIFSFNAGIVNGLRGIIATLTNSSTILAHGQGIVNSGAIATLTNFRR